MTERILRGIAGFFIVLSVILAVKININWLWFTFFVGLNLFQSAFTNWCLMMTILRKFGVKCECSPSEVAVNIFYLVCLFSFSKNNHRIFYPVSSVCPA